MKTNPQIIHPTIKYCTCAARRPHARVQSSGGTGTIFNCRFNILAAAIIVFAGLGISCSSSGGHSISKVLPEMEMPYVALNITLKSRVDIDNTSNEYLKNIEKETGLSPKRTKALFKYLRAYQTDAKVRENARNEIGASLSRFQKLPDDKKLNYFVINILAPYLTMIVNNFEVGNNDEDAIHFAFAELFNVPQGENNPLLEMAIGSLDYYNGGVFKSGNTYALNEYLKNRGFYLDYGLRKTHSNILKIDRAVCRDVEWKPEKKISVFVLNRAYPSFLGSRLGYAPAEHSDVLVMKNLHYHVAERYRDELKTKAPHSPYVQQATQKQLQFLGLDIDLVRANRIRYMLAYRDLGFSSISQIEKKLIVLTTVHEAKHRIDTIEKPEMILNLDMEVSAYLTAAIAGDNPFLGLRDALEWTQGYFQSTQYVKLGNLLRELWILAERSLDDKYTKESLKADLRAIYENYRTIMGNTAFVDLKEFEQRMMPLISDQ